MSEPRTQFYAIRRDDGEPIFDEYEWMLCDGPDDWTVAEESDHDDATEYRIYDMRPVEVARRTFGVWEDDLDDDLDEDTRPL